MEERVADLEPNGGGEPSCDYGERYSGCPTYYPPRLANGEDVNKVFPPTEWPLKLMSFKSHVMSSSTTMIERLRHVKPTNLVAIHPDDAQKWG